MRFEIEPAGSICWIIEESRSSISKPILQDERNLSKVRIGTEEVIVPNLDIEDGRELFDDGSIDGIIECRVLGSPGRVQRAFHGWRFLALLEKPDLDIRITLAIKIAAGEILAAHDLDPQHCERRLSWARIQLCWFRFTKNRYPRLQAPRLCE